MPAAAPRPATSSTSSTLSHESPCKAARVWQPSNAREQRLMARAETIARERHAAYVRKPSRRRVRVLTHRQVSSKNSAEISRLKYTAYEELLADEVLDEDNRYMAAIAQILDAAAETVRLQNAISDARRRLATQDKAQRPAISAVATRQSSRLLRFDNDVDMFQQFADDSTYSALGHIQAHREGEFTNFSDSAFPAANHTDGWSMLTAPEIPQAPSPSPVRCTSDSTPLPSPDSSGDIKRPRPRSNNTGSGGGSSATQTGAACSDNCTTTSGSVTRDDSSKANSKRNLTSEALMDSSSPVTVFAIAPFVPEVQSLSSSILLEADGTLDLEKAYSVKPIKLELEGDADLGDLTAVDLDMFCPDDDSAMHNDSSPDAL